MNSQTSEIQSPKLKRLNHAIQTADPAALDHFWAEIEQHGTPVIEPRPDGYSLVTFLWRDDGSTRSIVVIQDWGADGIREHFMARLPGSDVWFLTRIMRSDTRTTYQLSPSPSADFSEPGPYLLDPLNPRTITAFRSETGNDILFSRLELPAAPPTPWRETSPVHAGVVELHTPFADQRRLWVYQPPVHATRPLPMLLVFDGQLYKDQIMLPEILDYLIEQGSIPPVAALMLDNVDRSELYCKPEFLDYVANQVIPWFRSQYLVTVDPSKITAVGSSAGGLAAAHLAFLYSHIFGNVLSQSGWFRWRPEDDPDHHWLARQMAAAPRVSIKFWLQVGNLEVARMADGGPTQLAANQYLRDTLWARGYSVNYQEYSGGHDFSSLEVPLAQALVDILK